MTTHSARGTCALCGSSHPLSTFVPASSLAGGTRGRMLADWPELTPDAPICPACRARYRRQHLEALLEAERGELTRLDHAVLDSLESGRMLTQEPGAEADEARTLGERAADRLARLGGSSGFLIGFALVLALWMAVNVTGLVVGIFDPYPFILLNLMLSTLAAIQAPIIMMSQRRQEEKDRLRSENDYKVNLKAELEIRHLHETLEHHLARQWERLEAIQRLQIELLEEAAGGAEG